MTTEKAERSPCEACPVGKMIGQKKCPGTKLKLRMREWLKKHMARG